MALDAVVLAVLPALLAPLATPPAAPAGRPDAKGVALDPAWDTKPLAPATGLLGATVCPLSVVAALELQLSAAADKPNASQRRFPTMDG